MKYHLGQSQASCYVCLAKEWQRQYPLTALCRPTSATQHKGVIEESPVSLPSAIPASARRNETDEG